MAEFLLDTEAASRLMRAERRAVTGLRRSGAKSVSISSITMAELVYGARLQEATRPSWWPYGPSSPGYLFIRGMKRLLRRMPEFASVRRGRSAGAFDTMIAAHAEALGMTLVTSDMAVKNLKIPA